MSATDTLDASRAERIAAAGAAHALDEAAPAQLAEQLLEVRKRDVLAIRDARQRDRTVRRVQRDIDHRRDRERPLVVRRIIRGSFSMFLCIQAKSIIPDEISQL